MSDMSGAPEFTQILTEYVFDLDPSRLSVLSNMSLANQEIQDTKMQLDNPEKAVDQLKNGEIDESLYSRQLYDQPHLSLSHGGNILMQLTVTSWGMRL